MTHISHQTDITHTTHNKLTLLKLLVQVIPWAFEASEVCIIVLAAFFMIIILFHEYRLQGTNSEKSQLATQCTIYNEYIAMYNDYIPHF